MGIRERLRRFIQRDEGHEVAVEHVETTLDALAEAVSSNTMPPATAIEHAYELGWRLAERRNAQYLKRILHALRRAIVIADAAATEMTEDPSERRPDHLGEREDEN